jgi:predicted hydrocarbon binding protein
MQFTFKDILSRQLGKEQMSEIFIAAGLLAGKNFCQNVLDVNAPFETFIAQLKETLVDLKVGILRVEEADLDQLTFTLTVSEDLDCSGLPVFDESVCEYDEGFIAGILEQYTGKKFIVKEVDCWGTGERTCRFDVRPLGR